MGIISFHHVIHFLSGFDLLPVVKPALLLGGEAQEIPGSSMGLPVIPKQVKGTLDVRYLLRVKTWLIIILRQTNDAVYCLAENIACFEQQKTQTADDAGKGEILLMLYLYEWSGDFEEGVLLFRFGSFGFHLTSLVAISLYPAPSYK